MHSRRLPIPAIASLRPSGCSTRSAPDLRFLAHRVPTRGHLEQVTARAASTSVAESVRRIAESRRFRR
jgi:hypothetical protein